MKIVINPNIKNQAGIIKGARLVFIAGTIMSFYFATVLLQASFDWGLFLPFLACLLLAMAGRIKMKQPGAAISMKYKGTKYIIVFLLSLVLLSFIAVEGLIIHASVAAPSAQADYLLVLGAGIRGEEVQPLLQRRLDCAISYLAAHPDCKAILSGGQGRGEVISEAEAMRRYMVQKGIPAAQIIKEEKATSTFENLYYTKAILAAEGRPENTQLLVVTNDFHLYRTTLLAGRLRMNAEGLPCPTALIDIPHCYVREYFAVLKSLAVDRG